MHYSLQNHGEKMCWSNRIRENLNSKIFRTKNGRLIMQSKCADCGIRKSRFVKEQEAKALLSNLGIKTSLSKIIVPVVHLPQTKK